MPIITITHLVTHNGSFHAGELLSSVILTRLYPQAEVVRTRDAAWIAPGECRFGESSSQIGQVCPKFGQKSVPQAPTGACDIKKGIARCLDTGPRQQGRVRT